MGDIKVIAFISGHLDLTVSEFYKNYREWINRAIIMEDSFVVGDAIGTDWIAQTYLIACMGIDSNRLKLYHMLESPRCYYSGVELIGGFKSDRERDEAMTAQSDYDIAWVRPGRENSGTAKNLARRKK